MSWSLEKCVQWKGWKLYHIYIHNKKMVHMDGEIQYLIERDTPRDREREIDLALSYFSCITSLYLLMYCQAFILHYSID